MGYLSIEIKKGMPIYHYNDRPDFGKDIHARNRYIEQEMMRLHEGYESLTPFDYFDLTKNKMQDPTSGEIYRPRFLYEQKKLRDTILWCQNHKLQQEGFPVDGDGHDIIENGKTIPDPFDLVIIKPRRFGLTSEISSYMLYNAWAFEGCIQGVTSADDDRMKELVNNKLWYSKEGCVEEKLLTLDGRWNQHFVSFVFNNGNEIKTSSIYTPNTSHDDRAAQSVEGYGYKTFFIDEWFLHPRTTIVTNSVKATMLDRFKRKSGILIRGGSCNEANKESINKLKALIGSIENNKESKIKLLFIPGWVNQVEDEYGFTDVEKSMEKKIKERAALKKSAESGNSEDWIAYANEIKSYPFTLKELTGIVESDYINPTIKYNLDKGQSYAFNYKPHRCNLINRNDRIFTNDKIEHIPELLLPKYTKFPYAIYDEPISGDTYIAGCDPINFVGANPIGSMFALVIKNVTKERYVACLQFRTQDSMLGYNLWRNLLLMYKSEKFPYGALCMGEKNALSSIITMATTYGHLDLLAFDPFKKSASNSDRGYWKHTDTMPRIMHYGRNYLEKGFVPFDEFNQAFIKYTDDNDQKEKADICDAYLSCELLSQTYFVKKETNVPNTIKRTELIRNSQGALEYVPRIIHLNNNQ